MTLLWAAAAGIVVGAVVLLVVHGRRCTTLLPVTDVGALGANTRRTWLLWGGLASALVAVLIAFVLRADVQPASAAILPHGTNGVIVIDLSSSTRASSKKIGRALLGLARNGRRLGLVVFSDTAYEALPPSAPVESLRDWLQVFARAPARSYPWTPSFSGGTWISSGLVTARRILRADGVTGGQVLLVSDLVDGPSDLSNLQSIVAQYQRDGIQLSVIDVATKASGTANTPASFLQEPNANFVETAATRTISSDHLPRTTADLTPLFALLGALGLLAAVFELVLHPFTWRLRS